MKQNNNWGTSDDPAVILEKVRSRQPLCVAEIYRLAAASGEDVPTKSRFVQIARQAEQRFFEGLEALLTEDDLRPDKLPPRKKRRTIQMRF